MPRLTLSTGLAAMLALMACTPKETPKTASDKMPETENEQTEEGGIETGQKAPAPTLIGHRATFEKIVGNSGLSLQWISWAPENRGRLEAKMVDGTLWLKGNQSMDGQPAMLEIDGRVIAVTKNAFTFNGRVTISDAPDVGRNCVKEGMSKFAITQGRKYFRLREFEWCDGLTDYIDIYF